MSVSLLLVVLYSVASLTMAVDSSSSDQRLSPRIVTTKYGAYRGFIHNLPSRSLQPVEVFLGNVTVRNCFTE